MKRCLILVTSFMLLLGVTASADNVYWQKQGGGTELYIGFQSVMEMYAQTNAPSDACSFGFTFAYTAGGALNFDNTYGDGSVSPTPTNGQLYLRRHGDAVSGFNLLFAGNATGYNGGLPNGIAFGGSALFPSQYPAQAAPALFVSLRLDIPDDALNVNTTDGFCISASAIAPVTWEFTQGGPVPPDFNGNPTGSSSNPSAPAQCWDVEVLPCLPPVFTADPGASVNRSHCLTYSFDFNATEGGNTPAADPVTFASSAGTINAATGELTVNPIATCGSTDVIVTASNSCGSSVDHNFTINWTNNNPTITNCPAAVGKVGKGNTFNLDLNATDADPCDALTWSVSTGDSPVGAYSIDGTGLFSFASDDLDASNTYTFVAEVTDPCGGTSACTFQVEVLATEPFVIHIEKTHGTFQGHYEYVSITKEAGSGEMGGFDFLVGYDASALSFISAEFGADLGPAGLGWEYFTYRYGAFGNCVGPCPSGKLRVVAIADQNNGANHPNGFLVPNGGELAVLKFYVTNDRTFECQYVPVRFCWADCGDNSISNIGGDTLWISDVVYDFQWDGTSTDPDIALWDITDLSCYFAMSFGGACADCDVSEKYEPVRFIVFWNGGVDIICADSIDGRGDINLNGIENEIADAVLYTNYFLYGYNALDPNPQFREAQIAASDVNADGVPLTVGDLVYQLRIIVGDALPFPKLAPFANTANVTLANGTLSTNASVELGAVYATFDVNGAYDLVSKTDMEVVSAENDGQLKVLVYAGTSNMTNSIEAGAADLFTVNGDVELVSVEVADYSGNMLNTQVSKSVLPTSFALHQNVPNPFNPTTKIGLDLPTASDWSLAIYNVAGQLVESFNGNGVGTVNVEWDASNVASGIYFYKATVADWTQTKKMVLMK